MAREALTRPPGAEKFESIRPGRGTKHSTSPSYRRPHTKRARPQQKNARAGLHPDAATR